MMNIVIFTHSLSRSGAPKVAVDLANWLSSLGESVTIVHPSESDITRKTEISPQVNTKSLELISEGPLNKLLDFFGSNKFSWIGKRRKRFLSLVKELNPDVAIVNTFYWAVFSSWLVHARVPHIRYLHEGSYYLEQLSTQDVRWISKSNLVISASPSTSRDAEVFSAWTVGEGFYPYPAPDNFIAPSRVFYNQEQPELRIVSVGFPKERKGLNYIEEVANNLKNAIFVHGNDGDVVSENKLINLMGAGPINWSNYDMLLVLSVSEAWPIVAIEAAQHGVYVVGWQTIDTLIELEKHNLASTFEFGDVDSLSGFIQNWSPKFREQRRSYERFVSKFSANQIYGDIREILRTISSQSDYSQ